MSRLKFPTAFTILFGLIIAVAVATWVVPAGQYDRVMNDALGKEVPVPGTYQTVESNPQGIVDVFMAPIAGLYDPVSYSANAIDVAVFVLVIGGFLMVVTRTGAIDAGIARVMSALKGRENLMIPILMAFFAAGGTIYGMAEESLAFYALIIPVMIRAGYDSVTGVAVIMLGAGIGTLGSTINPFATVIASNAAGVPFTDGIVLRFIILAAGWAMCVAWVMRYAAKVKANPDASVVADLREEHRQHFLQNSNIDEIPEFTRTHAIIMTVFALVFAALIYGVAALGWWMGEMSALFLAASILVGIIARMGEAEFVDNFIDGARDLLGVALIIGVARGIVVIMDAGSITDTILFWSEQAVSGLSQIAFINVMFWLELVLSFFVPSSSGLAVLSMPIMAPLASFSDVSASLVVTAFQSASGLLNLINPTFAVVMGGLAIGRVPYDKWLRFAIPLVLLLFVMISIALSVSV
ncbi:MULTISPECIES: YfcC family protein [Pseudovibrio]|uniref:YfcC family protein n=1 Tax=Stappiaceae TaxID=2821832 RepID=UPI002366EC83|nr:MULTISPECIES: YfcC family protein [Pseudovibrio]MDD7910765.1 YfcC family protein [Pseudovibrio exalbescens]MDX5593526.1 YfcC family protein [Pseudovibrio sp. SPO723]